MTETLVAAGRVVTVLIAAAVLCETLVNVCQQCTLRHHSLILVKVLRPTRHKTSHIRHVLSSRYLGLVLKT